MTAVPTTTRELRSTVSDDGRVTLAIVDGAVAPPADHEVVVRVEASPINPSDLGMLFAGGDVSGAVAAGGGGHPAVSVPLSSRVLAANAARVGIAMPAGNEGGGTVIAAGSAPDAQAMVGKVVGFLSGNAYAEYRTIAHQSCIVMPDGVTAEQAAAAFVNPLTALGMVETMRNEGHTALVHTVGASNLGLMLNRICLADGIGLVNIVRRPEHVELLRSSGAEHVVDSSAESFTDDLVDALRVTGATIAFDAIGGGDLADTLLTAMERVLSAGAAFSRYGSDTLKQVYVYGGLDRGPTTLRRSYGLTWSVAGWLLTPFLAKLGEEGRQRLRGRVVDEIATTFASTYGLRIGLEQAVDPVVVQRYAATATGDKALLTPHA